MLFVLTFQVCISEPKPKVHYSSLFQQLRSSLLPNVFLLGKFLEQFKWEELNTGEQISNERYRMEVRNIKLSYLKGEMKPCMV